MKDKRNGKGNTVFTTAEFVREANKCDRRGSWNGARHAVNCPSATNPHAKGCICVKPVHSADVVRVIWDGVSHERLLYDAGRPHALFTFPRPYPKEPPYVPMSEYMRRISVASCGVSLWPKAPHENRNGNTHGLPAFDWTQPIRVRKTRKEQMP